MIVAKGVETVHYTNTTGSAETIRDALRLHGRGDRVVALPGDFSVGPLDRAVSGARQEWVSTVLRCDPDDERREDDGPWIEATSDSVHPVYWVCLANAYEHANFLQFADRMAGRPFDIIDATDLDIVEASGFKIVQRGQRTIPGLLALRPADIVASGLEGRRRSFTPEESEAARTAWARLRRENAPLRVMRDGELVSAPLTHFDAILTAQVTTEFEKVGYLIGRTMVHLAQVMEPPVNCPSDIVLFGRILAMGDVGALDIDGPGPGIGDYRVRAPCGG